MLIKGPLGPVLLTQFNLDWTWISNYPVFSGVYNYFSMRGLVLKLVYGWVITFNSFVLITYPYHYHVDLTKCMNYEHRFVEVFVLDSQFLWIRRTSSYFSGFLRWHSHVSGTIVTVTSQWERWRLKSPTSGMFAQPFVQAHINGHIKAPRHWSLWRESTGHRWIPLTKDQ